MLAEAFDAFLIDLDGVVYLGSEAIPGAATTLRELRTRSKAIRFLTNDPRPRRTEIVDRLSSYGITATVDEVITSGSVAAQFARLRGHRTVMVVGSIGLKQEANDAGIVVVDDGPADAVIVGCDETVCYGDLNLAVACITAGAEFIATNRDGTYPVTASIRAMATGGMVAAVETATGRSPITVGKPMPPMFQAAIRTLPAGASVAVVGDGPRTDIEGARRAELFAILVSDSAEMQHWPSTIVPDVVIRNLSDLFAERSIPLSKLSVPSSWPLVVQACVGGVVLNSAGQVLLERRRDADAWAVPTGRMEPGESLQQAIERELLEETGLVATAERLCGVYSDPSRQIFADEHGLAIHMVTTVFLCRADGSPVPDGAEVIEAGFFPPDRLPFPIPFGDDEWISDALTARSTGQVTLEYKTTSRGGKER